MTGRKAPIPARSIDHVAVAVPDLEAAMDLYGTVFGAEITEPVEVPEQGIRIAYAILENAKIELMEPLSPDSPVGRFLARNPKGGLHHFCLVNDDIPAAAEAAPGAGLRLIAPPARGHHGRELFFLHPAGTLGTLVEVEEPE